MASSVAARPVGGRIGPRRILALVALTLVGLVYLFPLYWIVATAIKGRAEIFAPEPSLVPKAPTIQPFISVLGDRGLLQLLINSVVVCGATVVCAILLGLLIAYPLTRLSVSRRLRANVLNWALSLRFLPPIAVVVPYFGLVNFLGLYNSDLALILVYTLFNLPFALWMLKGFLAEIPLEIEEAALVDGASRWQAFRRVLLPLATPGLLASGIIIFAFSWSEFLFALILTATPRSQTFPVGVQGLVTQFAILWNDMAAAAVIAIAIPLALMFAARRYVISGLTFGVIREK
ncbi:MAG TPA: carbohydrate ABC transporter permease [Candidatus Limnocylindrales bacterium]|jgi:multiple sugar transport system permease protein